jgi:hypothetical protein
LADGGKRDQLCELLTRDAAYLHAKYRRFKRDALYQKDLQRAIPLFAESNSQSDLLAFIALSFAKHVGSQRTQAYTIEDLPALIELNQLDEAHGLDELQPNVNQRFNAEVLFGASRKSGEGLLGQCLKLRLETKHY